ncbi:MAG: DNA methyltransferase [Roseiflexaceae bacterium]|nr:DNA methyltransferase [Roseiflexaceae bacterium]
MSPGVSKTKWNGNGSSSKTEIPNTSLDVSLSYEGKRDITEILATPPAITRLIWGRDDAENFLYYGDNLPILSLLLKKQSLVGKVRLVYIDPPFATRSVYKSRSQRDAYQDLLCGAHYVEFLRQRLIFLRELLADDGSIYVHLDENMAFPIKVIMDEIFGKANFRNWITRKKCNPKNYTRKTFGNISDYILFYTKSDNYVWNRPVQPWTEETARKEYQYIEEETGRRYKKVPLHAPGVRNGETGKPWRGMLPPPGKHWQFTPQTLDEMDARGEIHWSPTGNPRRKVYLDESGGVPVQDIWLDFKDAHNQNVRITGYPTEKNPDMLALIVRASSNPGDIVLDCFSGSGTALEVASQLGRRWVGIDNSPEAIRTTLYRFAHGTEPMGDFVGKQDQQRRQEQPSMRLFRITDFALHVTEPYMGDINEIVSEWEDWLK